MPSQGSNRAFGPCREWGSDRSIQAIDETGGERVSATEPEASIGAGADAEEHFKPTGTIFLLGCFVAMLILLWVTVYLILLSRGATG